MGLTLVIGLIASAAIAGAAYRLRSLSLSGFFAAIGVGTVLYISGSIAWFGTLIIFFVTASSWSKWRKSGKQQTGSLYEKGGRRDAGQVLANGGLAVLLSAGYTMLPHEVWWYAFVGVMGTVTADTWATEIGSISRQNPRSILNGRQVPRGTSGGISLLGSLAAGGGAFMIGLTAFGLLLFETHILHQQTIIPDTMIIGIALIGGIIGAMTDSLLGATIQHMRKCSICGKEVEHRIHCHMPAVHIRGWSWMNNDAVNIISSLAGGGIAIVIWICYHYI
jgi:uncharacterized protein (TIGR00297 family)